MVSGVEQAVAAFTAGNPVMVFDSAFRERETDLLWPADAATPEVMRTLRRAAEVCSSSLLAMRSASSSGYRGGKTFTRTRLWSRRTQFSPNW